jgi:hypothetical protein
MRSHMGMWCFTTLSQSCGIMSTMCMLSQSHGMISAMCMLSQNHGLISTMCMLSQSCGTMWTLKAGVSWVDGLHQHLMHYYHVSSFALCLFTMRFVVGTLFLFWNSGVHGREDHWTLKISKSMFFMCVILLVLIVLSTKSISNGAQYVTLDSKIKCLSLDVLFLATHQ